MGRNRKVSLKVTLVLPEGKPYALLDVLNGLREDLEAMQKAGEIVDYAVEVKSPHPSIISLDEEGGKNE